MNDLERELTDLFHRRAAGAAVVDALDDVVDGARLTTVEQQPVAGRRRSPILAIAAALVILAAVSVAWLARTTLRTPSPDAASRVQFPTAVPAAPMASDEATNELLRTVFVLSRDEAGTTLGVTQMEWPPSDGTVTDLDGTTPGGLYVATCCASGAEIWRNGEEFERGIRLDYLFDGLVKATVDPATDTVTVGAASVRTTGTLDVAVQDPYRVLVLIGGTEPGLLELTSARFDDVEPRRERTPLPPLEGMCGLAALRSVTMVLVGTTDASGRCVVDRALALDGDDHHLLTTLRFPTSFVVTNSDHQGRLVGVTADGRVLVGTLGPSATPAMTWVTLSLPPTAVAAAFR